MNVVTYETPNSPKCIRCAKCISICPKGAIKTILTRSAKSIDINEKLESN